MEKRQFIKACEAIAPGVTVEIDTSTNHNVANLAAPDGFKWDGELHWLNYTEWSGGPVAGFYDRAWAEFSKRTNGRDGCRLIEVDEETE